MSKLSVDIDVSGDVFSNGGGNTGEGAVLKEGTMKKKAIGKRFAVANFFFSITYIIKLKRLLCGSQTIAAILCVHI